MNKFKLNMRKVVAIAICLAGSATMFAQDNTTDEGVIINGVKWATRNVDVPGTFAVNPEDAGMFYQWNRNIGWSASDPMINSNGGTTWDYSFPYGIIWEKANDPSPSGWRVPTHAEIQKLLDTDKVKNEWIDEKNGREYTDLTTGKKLFLPAVGFRHAGDEDGSGMLLFVGLSGFYWSSTVYSFNKAHAYCLESLIDGASWDTNIILNGLPVRPVAENGNTSVNDFSADPENAVITGFFDMLGRRLNEEPAKGTYIIKYNNGMTKKMMK